MWKKVKSSKLDVTMIIMFDVKILFYSFCSLKERYHAGDISSVPQTATDPTVGEVAQNDQERG